MNNRHDGPMHEWFGLSYASYLVIPRSLIQEMPLSWQSKFRKLLDEMHREFPNAPGIYTVQIKDENGKFCKDPLRNYRRPNQNAIDKCRRNP